MFYYHCPVFYNLNIEYKTGQCFIITPTPSVLYLAKYNMYYVNWTIGHWTSGHAGAHVAIFLHHGHRGYTQCTCTVNCADSRHTKGNGQHTACGAAATSSWGRIRSQVLIVVDRRIMVFVEACMVAHVTAPVMLTREEQMHRHPSQLAFIACGS